MLASDSNYTAVPDKADEVGGKGQWRRVFEEALASNKEEHIAIATSINERNGLTDGNKLYVMYALHHSTNKYKDGTEMREAAIRLDVCYGVVAGAVPILILFGQTYKETEVVVFGCHLNVGTVLSIIAVMCSLLGSIVHVIQKSAKKKEIALLDAKGGMKLSGEIAKFASQCPPYDDADPHVCFRTFVQNFHALRSKYSKSNAIENAQGTAGDSESPAETDK